MAEEAAGPFHQTGDLLLWSRLVALVDAGLFEYRGDLSSMRNSEIRRAAQRK